MPATFDRSSDDDAKASADKILEEGGRWVDAL
jgi:hypothetical protein